MRPKLSCACCSRIVQEPAPHRPIERGTAGPGPLAHVLVAKYADHLPLYRQSEIYAREGVELDRSTLADWVGGASRTLRPLVDELKKYVLSAEKLHGDDVPVPVLEPGNGAKRKRAACGLYVRDDRPSRQRSLPSAVIWFAYSPDRKRRASDYSSEKLSWHPAGRWLCGLQPALRKRGDLWRPRVGRMCAVSFTRSVSGAPVAGCERSAGADRSVVRD